MTEKLFVPLTDRAVISVTGEDARIFLQGLVSNDVDRVAPDRAIYAALLSPQGRYLFDFFIVEMGSALCLDCEAARLEALLKRLALYKLRAKVTLSVAGEFTVFAAFGDGALAALGLEAREGQAREFAGGIAYCDPRRGAAGARAILPSQNGKKALEERGFQAADFAAYDALRIGLGLPDSGRDLVADRALLLECGFEALNGVDFEKGCYVGQEVTTRMKRRALIKKQLMPVKIEGPAPEAGTKIMHEGVEVGEMRSSRAGVGLALLRLDMVEGSRGLKSGEARIVPRP